MWPGLGGEGLTAGKDAVKVGIEKHGGKVTSGFSNIMNFLVIGTSPGPKKVLDAHAKGIQIVTLDQVNSVIANNDMAVEDLAGPYPDAAIAILAENGIQVQHLFPLPDLQEQSAMSTSTDIVVQGHNAGFGVGHRNA
jgi:BRCT domain type II-containing protein